MSSKLSQFSNRFRNVWDYFFYYYWITEVAIAFTWRLENLVIKAKLLPQNRNNLIKRLKVEKERILQFILCKCTKVCKEYWLKYKGYYLEIMFNNRDQVDDNIVLGLSGGLYFSIFFFANLLLFFLGKNTLSNHLAW